MGRDPVHRVGERRTHQPVGERDRERRREDLPRRRDRGRRKGGWEEGERSPSFSESTNGGGYAGLREQVAPASRSGTSSES